MTNHGAFHLWRGAILLWLALWTMTILGAAASGEKTYVVQRGDTLSGIAHTYGVSLSSLAQRNKIKQRDLVRPGQRLIIPAKPSSPSSAARKPASPTLPSAVQRAINAARVKPGRWKHIVIHHSGVNTGTMKGMDRYHRDTRHMENGLAYHFVIGNGHGLGDGEIGVGGRWTQQLDGGHLISEEQNKVCLGICLVGNFDHTHPTARQMERLTLLIRALLTRCNLPVEAVTTHQRINVVHTRCPGAYFPFESQLLPALRQR